MSEGGGSSGGNRDGKRRAPLPDVVDFKGAPKWKSQNKRDYRNGVRNHVTPSK